MTTNPPPTPGPVRIVVNPEEIDLLAVSALLESCGMRARKPDDMHRAISNSTDVVAAYDGATLIGLGRMISDRAYYGSIWDVAVQLEHQHRQIGTRIVSELLECARRRGLYMIGLFTASHNRAFYEHLGFVFLQDVHAMTTALAQDASHT